MAAIGGGLFKLDVDKEYHHRAVFFEWIDLAYDNY